MDKSEGPFWVEIGRCYQCGSTDRMTLPLGLRVEARGRAVNADGQLPQCIDFVKKVTACKAV
ncbi:hypothetical protein [Burkholderia metallica]|uniref:hypothetical protein n=1 Tax=Burkholderia metallica TaxID=488729 RepID=UPI00158B38FE|nr:hypothetical protein [Burkholderia metallica]